MKKPEARIYSLALFNFGCEPENAYFVGDSLRNDFEAPRELGIKSVLLDRSSKHEDIFPKIKDLTELLKLV